MPEEQSLPSLLRKVNRAKCIVKTSNYNNEVTGSFLASVVILFVAWNISESGPHVTNAHSSVIGFTTIPVSERRGVAVIPDRRSTYCGCEFVQSDPVIARRNSVSASAKQQ